MMPMTVQEDYETRTTEAAARRLAIVCPNASEELDIAERKAAEVVAKAQAKRDEKNAAISVLIQAASSRAKTLSYAVGIRQLTTIDLNALGERAAQAFIDSQSSPSTHANSIYELAVMDLVRLTLMRPHFLKLLADTEADCARQLTEIKALAKKEGISLPVLLDFLKSSSGLSEDRKSNLDPELLGLINNGYFAALE